MKELEQFVLDVGVAVSFTIDGIKFSVCPGWTNDNEPPDRTIVRYDGSDGSSQVDSYGIAERLVEARAEMIKEENEVPF